MEFIPEIQDCKIQELILYYTKLVEERKKLYDQFKCLLNIHDKNSTANIIFNGKNYFPAKTGNKLFNIVLEVLVNPKTQEKDIKVIAIQRNN